MIIEVNDTLTTPKGRNVRQIVRDTQYPNNEEIIDVMLDVVDNDTWTKALPARTEVFWDDLWRELGQYEVIMPDSGVIDNWVERLHKLTHPDDIAREAFDLVTKYLEGTKAECRHHAILIAKVLEKAGYKTEIAAASFTLNRPNLKKNPKADHAVAIATIGGRRYIFDGQNGTVVDG